MYKLVLCVDGPVLSVQLRLGIPYLGSRQIVTFLWRPLLLTFSYYRSLSIIYRKFWFYFFSLSLLQHLRSLACALCGINLALLISHLPICFCFLFCLFWNFFSLFSCSIKPIRFVQITMNNMIKICNCKKKTKTNIINMCISKRNTSFAMKSPTTIKTNNNRNNNVINRKSRKMYT